MIFTILTVSFNNQVGFGVDTTGKQYQALNEEINHRREELQTLRTELAELTQKINNLQQPSSSVQKLHAMDQLQSSLSEDSGRQHLRNGGEVTHQVTSEPSYISTKQYKPGLKYMQEGFDAFDNKAVVTIRGLYSSGTNLFRALLKKNCPQVMHENKIVKILDSDGLYGWKHGAVTEFEVKNLLSKGSEKHQLVLVTRDVFSWLSSTLHHVHDRGFYGTKLQIAVRNQENVSPVAQMKAFLSNPMETPCSTFLAFIKTYYKQECKPFIVHEHSVLDWRSRLYQNIIDLKSRYPEKIFTIQYEDIGKKPGAGGEKSDMDNLRDIVVKMGLESSCIEPSRFQGIDNYVKFGKQHSKKYSGEATKAKLCSMFDEENFNHVALNANLLVEYEMGYQIPTTYQAFKEIYGC